MSKKLILIVIPVILIFFVYLEMRTIEIETIKEEKIIQLIEQQDMLFDISNISDLDYIEEYDSITLLNAKYELKAELGELYNVIGISNDPQNTVVIFPMFTSSAYSEPGFYTYYRGDCGIECLTVNLNDDVRSEASGAAAQVLRLLGYEIISDVHVAKNPDILKQYDKVILLHNEYVTQKEFEAITNHPKVMYLYPNALYGNVQFNEKENTITLIRGHGYPESSVDNGFDWEFDNTRPYEFDTTCLDMIFYEIDNGIMLNCYPEQIMISDKNLLKAIKDF